MLSVGSLAYSTAATMLRAAPQAPAQNAQLRRLSGAGAARTLASGGGGRRGVLAAHPPSQAVGTQHPPIQLKAERLTPEAFAPFGQASFRVP